MKKYIAVLLSILCLVLSGCGGADKENAEVEERASEGCFTLTFITIGKGDAFLMEAPEGGFYLMDTGKAQDFQQIVRVLRLKGADSLEGIFLSHGHKDHAGCLKPLLEDVPVKKVYISAEDHVSYTEIDPRKILPEFENTELVELQGGEIINLGGAEAQVWIPPCPDYKNANNNSMILRVSHGENSFLLMGDAELEEEALFMNSDFTLKSGLLKLGHHGETDATSAAFLDKVQPEIALIAGNEAENPDSVNPYISRELEERGIIYYYSEGDSLDFISDGSSIKLQTVKDRELPRGPELEFTEVDRRAQRITVKNISNEEADLSRCCLISERGDEIYHFPSGCILKPGEELSVACVDSELESELIWDEASVWKKHGDNALLYDRNMNLICADKADK